MSFSLSPIVVALDFDNEREALALIDQLDPKMCRLKIGKEMFTHFGPNFVKALVERQYDVFLDLKFHDIPNTVAKACRAAADLGVWMVNVHASGGEKMMSKAKESLQSFGDDAPLLIAVTVLTSMSEPELHQVGVSGNLDEQVLRLATLTRDCGLDGVVCSAQEAQTLKSALGQAFKLVTPGIRLATSAKDDQTRVMTPDQAIINGSDYLVIGRPITQSSQPLQTLCEITESIADTLKA
ncbi:orotidine-5'-phosphate decarboxylase [Pleionea litopenaei]|uniref:Orotidine 5'-phosphate decarboxylase n=1 Tax=Pleionea litopenaei TaxID=3070815 RepID=A0AA51X6L7_9GAMM|nr:orotidine-5'-phosphate decarboxylase [Pleionea sp. HL-JVS1]WMS87263.1 orotidine-5'-phosphate decarboxylase [Pleionea sp. HL-JVS1]